MQKLTGALHTAIHVQAFCPSGKFHTDLIELFNPLIQGNIWQRRRLCQMLLLVGEHT